jgi:hypothetical protein
MMDSEDVQVVIGGVGAMVVEEEIAEGVAE